MDPKRIQAAVERSELIDTLTRFSRAVDTRDWDACRALLDDTVIDDHGTPVTLSREAVIESYRLHASVLDMLQHMNGNYAVVVHGDVAKITCESIVTMLAKGAPGGDLGTYGGTTDYDLKRTDEGWKVTGYKGLVKWSMGNAQILQEVLARAQKR